uniref:Uncharacterized protein n=1 Tax=Oryza barthii TaxID=65489 RepID=A0A0D3GBE8_9ORYZ
MVKLATAREARMYGPALAVRRWEYINAGAYDAQLGLVELLVPALHVAGCVLAIVAMALLLSQGERETHAANTLLAAALVWLLGSILNSCQVYERADGRAQLLQSSVQVPMLLGSLLFLVGAVVNRRRRPEPPVLVVSARSIRSSNLAAGVGMHDAMTKPCGLTVTQGRSWAWTMCVLGSVLWLVAAVFNMGKVFVMHQSDAPRLEKLRGGAQERLSRDREGRVPLNWEEAARSRRVALPAELR